jgi:hypothetical protein
VNVIGVDLSVDLVLSADAAFQALNKNDANIYQPAFRDSRRVIGHPGCAGTPLRRRRAVPGAAASQTPAPLVGWPSPDVASGALPRM